MAGTSLLLKRLGAVLALGLTWPVQAADAQPVKQVAIIGAGAAGSSAAYHLHMYAEQHDLLVNITVFEKTGRIGGRTLTVNPHGDADCNIELGASLFVEVNQILMNATRDFNLDAKEHSPQSPSLMGIWNGDEFVYEQSSTSWEWWNLAKLLWKYGMAPYRVDKLARSTVANFLQLYEAPWFPFESLSARAAELQLTQLTNVTGEQYLDEHQLHSEVYVVTPLAQDEALVLLINARYARDLIQTSTRVNYMSNLPFIHGLTTMVVMSINGATAIAGGNWKIFKGMIDRSRAALYLNTTVSSIQRKGDNSAGNKFVITTADSHSSGGDTQTQSIEFDDVIIATPWQFSNIRDEDQIIEQPIEDVTYAKLHVTLLASPFRFSPEFFNLPAGAAIPNMVYTTLAEGEDAKPGSEGAGKAGFFSVSEVGTVKNPKTGGQEYVYKIFSPDAVTPEFLSALLGAKVPDTFVGSGGNDGEAPEQVEPVSWYHPAVFHPYPQLTPRVTFTDPVVGRGLYYTSGIEPFISTMETSALMGKNVARLVIEDYLRGDAIGEQDKLLGPDQNKEQVVVGLHASQEGLPAEL